MLDSSAIIMAVKQERNGTRRMQTKNSLDKNTIEFIKYSRDPDVMKWYENKARTSALILHRWLRPKLAKKFSVEEHAKFFFIPTASAHSNVEQANAEAGPDIDKKTPKFKNDDQIKSIRKVTMR